MSDSVWRFLSSNACKQADAIRFSCILEATAPKVGNVHPGARFEDLSYADFVTAANLTAQALAGTESGEPWDAAIARAVSACVAATHTNVNLGIVLLLAPLVASEPEWQLMPEVKLEKRCVRWQTQIKHLLAKVDLQQGATIARAISDAAPGGLSDDALGEDHPFDLARQEKITSYDLIEAMRVAAPRDRIARQYADDFHDLFDVVVPTLHRCVLSCGDLLTGIVHAHVVLIAAEGDSLIARKCGEVESDRVAQLARECWSILNSENTSKANDSIRKLDMALRTDGNRLNPGTTADLLAAAIYVLVRAYLGTA